MKATFSHVCRHQSRACSVHATAHVREQYFSGDYYAEPSRVPFDAQCFQCGACFVSFASSFFHDTVTCAARPDDTTQICCRCLTHMLSDCTHHSTPHVRCTTCHVLRNQHTTTHGVSHRPTPHTPAYKGCPAPCQTLNSTVSHT